MAEKADDSGRRETSESGTELGRSKAETVHPGASGGALNKIISGLQKSESMEDQDDFPKKKGSFQIMSVKSRGGSGEHGLDGEVDSIDEMDESKTDDILSDKVDFDLNDTETEKTTDVETARVTHASSNKRPTDSTEDADIDRYMKSVTDVQSRFKVVKIQTKQPYKRGRWSCYDYLDPNLEKDKADVKPEERAEVVCSDSSSTGGGSSLLHYMIPGDDGATKETQVSQNTVNASAATHKATIQENSVTDPYIAKIDTSVHGSSSMVAGYRKAPKHLEATGKTPLVDKHTDVQSSDTTRMLDCAKNEMPYAEEVVDNQLRPKSALSYGNSAPENIDNTFVSILPDSSEKEFLSNQIVQRDTGTVGCGGPSQITSTSTSVVAGAGHRVDMSDIQTTDPEPASLTASEPEKKRLHPAVGKIKGDTNSSQLLEATAIGTDQGTGTASTGVISVLPGNNTSNIQAEIQISGVPRNVVQADAITSKPSDPPIGVTSSNTPETQGAVGNLSIEPRGLTEGLAGSRQMSLINSTLGPPLMELVAASSGPLSPNGEGSCLSEREQSDAVAIDNKIEQAMDLVKSHLMFAVREEVEVLKEQINELIVKNQHLEKENSFLKSAATPETLGKLQDQEMPPTAPTSISKPPQNNMSSSVNSS